MLNQSLSSDAPEEKTAAPDWNTQNTRWVFSLFGTAVGAGILFLPMNAGQGGIWPLLLMTLFVGPMTYFAHRGLALLVLSGKDNQSDVTQVVQQHFGKNVGFLLALGYFFAIYPILLIYGVSLTNTIDHCLAQYFNLHCPRVLLAFILVALMMAVMGAGEKIMLRITQVLVYPLVLFLLAFSVYLIPQWDFSLFAAVPTFDNFIHTLWLTLPVLVFSFNHSPAISSFVCSQRRAHADRLLATQHTESVLKWTSVLLVFFVMFFVYSCVFALTPEQLSSAKAQNISILSVFVQPDAYPFMAYLAPFVAIVAIVSSFFGHYLGAREGLNAILLKCMAPRCHQSAQTQVRVFTTGFLFVTLWAVAVINPSILGLIESFVGPVIACILFLLPMYAISKVPTLRKYKGALSNVFVILTGVAVVSATLHGLLA